MKRVFESDDINEKLITIKRKYTEKYPELAVGKTAKIRNKILEILKDGQISREEFFSFLEEITTDSNRWLRRNSQYFNISEDSVSLSKIGNTILKNIVTSDNIVKTSNMMTYEEFSRKFKK